MYLSMSTLYSIIDIILSRQFKKLLKIQNVIILISLTTAIALLCIRLTIEIVEAEPYGWGKASM